MDINCYLADFRYDEGLRVRKDLILPTINLHHACNEGGMSGFGFVIEVCNAKGKKRNNERIYRSTGGGGDEHRLS